MTITSDVISASYGVPQPELEDIYARKIDGFMLGEDYEQERAYITINVW